MTPNERYLAAAHKVQSAIAAIPDHANQTPKHLRVGVDMGKSDARGLAQLLIAKGVFTLDEYLEAVVVAAEQEAKDYAEFVSEHLGVKVTLL